MQRKKIKDPEAYAQLRGMALVKATVKLKDLAAELGITYQAIKMWDHVPKARVAAVAAMTGVPEDKLTQE